MSADVTITISRQLAEALSEIAETGEFEAMLSSDSPSLSDIAFLRCRLADKGIIKDGHDAVALNEELRSTLDSALGEHDD